MHQMQQEWDGSALTSIGEGKRQKPIKHQASRRLVANQSSYRHKVQMHWWKLKLCEDEGTVSRNCELEIVPKCKCAIYIELWSVNLRSINAWILYAVRLRRPLVIFNILGKYQVFKMANCRSAQIGDLAVYWQEWCVHNTSPALIFLYPRCGYNWKWQTDLICHFPTRELSFLRFPARNKRSNSVLCEFWHVTFRLSSTLFRWRRQHSPPVSLSTSLSFFFHF